ncbi:G protein coupled receptor fragment [Echinococcus multilocularis]|uniref:G protein coupled receptor n=1 Tax=Echinococcus multilocularis TaxID=6211 RepID=A0A068Y6F0_ECHMU|nr:G protein coupled receptor fragment [Echinococcus multilocularis]
MEPKNITTAANNSVTTDFILDTHKYAIIAKEFSYYVNTLNYNVNKRIVMALYCLIFLLGSCLNLLLVYTIMRVRNPKSTSNRRMLLMHVCCDLALVWFGVPYTAYTVVYKSWQLGSVMCHVASFLIYFIVGLTNFLLVSICLNRSIAIARAGRWAGESDYDVNCRVTALLTAAIVLAVVIALPSAIVSRVTNNIFKDPLFTALAPPICIETWSSRAKMAYDLTLIITIYFIPLIVICLSHHIVTQQLRRSHQMLSLMGHAISAKWRRRRQRLIRLCVLMTTLFVLSWFPNHLCNILTKIFDVRGDTAETLQDYALCLGISNTVSEPLLLIITCSAYQRFIRRLLARWSLVKSTTDAVEPIVSSSIGVPALPTPVPQLTNEGKSETQVAPPVQKET